MAATAKLAATNKGGAGTPAATTDTTVAQGENGEENAGEDEAAPSGAVAKLRAAVNAASTISAMNRCRDVSGKLHDASVLRAKRHKAMHKAMSFMHKFLTKNNNKNLYTIGDDAPSIFFEMWYSTAESTIRTRAKEIAKVMFEKLEARVCGATAASLEAKEEHTGSGKHRKRIQASARLSSKEPSPSDSYEDHRESFFECLFMLRCKYEMGLDHTILLRRADLCWQYGRLGEPDEPGGTDYGFRLYGIKKSNLHTVNTDDWLMLLMRILIVEYVNLLLSNRYVVRNYGLRESFEVLRCGGMSKLCRIPASDAEQRTRSEEWRHSFYLATHIVFAHSAYSGIKTNVSDAPWLYRYLRKSLKFMLKMSREKAKNPSVYVDCDGIGECVDCLRGLGLTEASDPQVCSGTNWLLKYQKKDGSWPVWFLGTDGYGDEDTDDPYDVLHPTWVCTQALRDRDFRVNEEPTRKWKAYIEKILKETNFAVLKYKPEF